MTAIRLNGEPQELSGATLDALLRQRGLDPTRRGIAVAVNGAVVPRSRWTSTPLRAGDAVEIVRSFQGG